MQVSDFLARKLTRRFQTFDFDGDGRIERSDFETSAARLADDGLPQLAHLSGAVGRHHSVPASASGMSSA